MDNIKPEDEHKLLAYLYDGDFKHTMRICLRIDVSYASIMRYRKLADPLSRLRYGQFRDLVQCYNEERGEEYASAIA